MCFHMQILLQPRISLRWYLSIYLSIYLPISTHTHQHVDHIYQNGNCSLHLGLEIISGPKMNKLFKNNFTDLRTHNISQGFYNTMKHTFFPLNDYTDICRNPYALKGPITWTYDVNNPQSLKNNANLARRRSHLIFSFNCQWSRLSVLYWE